MIKDQLFSRNIKSNIIRNNAQAYQLATDINKKTNISRIWYQKFTRELSREEVSFLDTLVKLRDGLYIQTCIVNPQLRYVVYCTTQSTPFIVRKSSLTASFLRIRHICNNRKDFDKYVLQFSSFHKRGYPSQLVEDAFIKARRMNRNNLLDPKDPVEDTKLYQDNSILVTTFHPHNQTIPNIISSFNWDMFGKSYNTLFLHQTYIMSAYCRPHNLWDILVWASTSKKPPQSHRPVKPGPSAEL